ncbi:hypothetical protein K435DRAFT_857892 [Dendrothele bispora CBS 962.96]|uniref:AMP-dependent synthetase/ligase domain-containing protein n=1 Tax=Dendrothele bispora (strain CBS 962.96) TaxID=1314807 RepID=A0A4S8M5L9_DENBC|nr:hypothetical protein K435DRAFT_857892 [Dendrothele bispora CBS 962.96]
MHNIDSRDFPDAGLVKSRAQYTAVAPSVLQTWSEDEEAIRALSRSEAVAYGGGPLPKFIGDKFVARGVNLQNVYEITETSVIFSAFPSIKPGYDWEYSRFAIHVKPRLVADGDKWILQVEVKDGIRAFDTRDVVEEHPVKKGYYRLVGRADDQIMMEWREDQPWTTGTHHCFRPLVKSCFMFGRSRTQVGIAIEPYQPIDLSSASSIATFRSAIWSSIQQANSFAPQHSIIVCKKVRKRASAKLLHVLCASTQNSSYLSNHSVTR